MNLNAQSQHKEAGRMHDTVLVWCIDATALIAAWTLLAKEDHIV